MDRSAWLVFILWAALIYQTASKRKIVEQLDNANFSVEAVFWKHFDREGFLKQFQLEINQAFSEANENWPNIPGPETVLGRAIDNTLPNWYIVAIEQSGLNSNAISYEYVATEAGHELWPKVERRYELMFVPTGA